jgi:spore coat polysaccharide biosynthesis protein SpsF
VVATTVDALDDPIVELAGSRGWAVERGSEADVLDRDVQAARAHDADVVVRIASDCPLIDPSIIDQTIERFRSAHADYASNSLEPRTYPRGLDVEVISRDALERSWLEDDNSGWSEHVSPFLYRHPERFHLARLTSREGPLEPPLVRRRTGGLRAVSRIYEFIGTNDFGWRDALHLVPMNPAWMEINRRIVQKVVSAAEPSG